MLFGAENPPGVQYISGSQDALGLMMPGINRLDYDGDFHRYDSYVWTPTEGRVGPSDTLHDIVTVSLLPGHYPCS